jgi:hypothetical protein
VITLTSPVHLEASIEVRAAVAQTAFGADALVTMLAASEADQVLDRVFDGLALAVANVSACQHFRLNRHDLAIMVTYFNTPPLH